MTFISFQLLLLIALIFTELNAEVKILPIKNFIKNLHREPPLEPIAKTKNTQIVQELWIEQPLDHFVNETTTWHMRYLLNDQYYNTGGPIFIFVGGEWEISTAFLLTGHMYDMAREHNGIMYYTEHRFYGKSRPTNNTTMNNLKYLHSRQALADLAYFIQQQKTKIQGLQNAAVILTGGSYAGSMVAWFSELYPSILTAGWASSAPLQAKLDFHEYLEHVGVVIKTIGGAKCLNRINNAIGILEQSMTSEYAHVILEQLKLCQNFDASNKLNLAAFFNAIGNYFGALVQSYSDSIRPTCDYLLTLHPGDDFAAFIDYLTDIFLPEAHYHEDFCIDLSYEATKGLFTDIYDLDTGSRQWFYQTCMEFGWFTTSIELINSNETVQNQSSLFDHFVNLNFFQQLCADVFDTTHTLDNLKQRIQFTNNFYKSKGEYGTIIMTHGELDPWRAVGRLYGANVLLIPGYSHVADLSSININDTVAMNVAKLKVATFIRQHIWLSKNAQN